MRITFLAVLFMGLAVGPAQSQSRLPVRGGTETFPAAAAVAFDVAGTTNCVVLFTGPASILRGDATGPTTNRVIITEIVSLSLTGSLPGVGPVTLRAGSNLVGRASVGAITSTNNVFPAPAAFDVFAEIGLPGGTNLINTTALRLETQISQTPALSQTFTNIGAADLVEATDTNTVVGEIIQFSLTPATRGQQRHLNLSANVTGSNDVGALTFGICADTQDVAVASLRGQLYDGPFTPNAGCDAGLDTNLLFAAKWNTNLRAPDWRGFHSGRFILFRVTPAGKTNLFGFGSMEGSNGVGTRRAPLADDVEDCAACYRFEGKLKGRIIESGTLSSARIEATYAGEHLDSNGDPIGCCPPPATPPSGAYRLTLDGVIVTRCP